MAVGIIAAQSIGEPGTQLTMRTFHIGGVGGPDVEESEIRAKKAGVVKFIRMKVCHATTKGQHRAHPQRRNLDSGPQGPRTGEVRRAHRRRAAGRGEPGGHTGNRAVPSGTRTASRSWPKSAAGSATRTSSKARPCAWRRTPAATCGGSLSSTRATCTRKSCWRTATARCSTSTTCPKEPTSRSTKARRSPPARSLAKTPREVSGTQDITGGLPRVTEIFEARKPKDPAVIAEIDGIVELLGEKRRGKRTIIVRSESGIEREHLVSHGKHFRVHSGDFVRAGEALVDGPLVPHDILRISGEEAVQQYLLREIQNVYRSQRVEINDKHIEIIVAQMLRKVRVENTGDTNLLPGSVMDKFEFRVANTRAVQMREDRRQGRQRLRGGRHRAPGGPGPGQRPDRVAGRRACQRDPAPGMPRPAPSCWASPRPPCKAASFISAASFQETTKVLTEAALAGKVDNLVGLKENVILGHLIPAGTGFRIYQESEVRIRSEALEALAAQKDRALVTSFPLLETAGQQPEVAGESELAEAREALGGDGADARSGVAPDRARSHGPDRTLGPQSEHPMNLDELLGGSPPDADQED